MAKQFLPVVTSYKTLAEYHNQDIDIDNNQYPLTCSHQHVSFAHSLPSDPYPFLTLWYLLFRKLRSWHLVPSLHGKQMGKQWKQCQTLFWGAPNTADGDCSHEIKRHLLLGRKVMINLDSILKSRDITLPTKVHRVKAMVFPVVMYGCESWTVKKAEH